MNPRARANAAYCAIALACAASVVAASRHRAIASTRATADLTSPAPLPHGSTQVAVALAPPTAPVGPPSNSSSGTGSDEEELMSLLRSARDNDAAFAIELAREGNRRFPESPAAPERASILIHALAEQGLASEARGEAEAMVNRYPDSAWVREVERFTGARRHRDIQVGPDGELRYVGPAPADRLSRDGARPLAH